MVTSATFYYLHISKADRPVALEVDGSGLDAGDDYVVREDSRLIGASESLSIETLGFRIRRPKTDISPLFVEW